MAETQYSADEPIDEEGGEYSDVNSPESPMALMYDNGEVVDPATEGSCLMALQCQGEYGNESEYKLVDPSEMETQLSAELWESHQDAINKLLSRCGPESETSASVPNGAAGTNASMESAPTDWNGNGEEGGMGEPSMSELYAEGMSRAGTTEEEEWILEDILKRRRMKQASTSAEDRYDDDGKATDGLNPYEYLCKWKWYDEPTWETGTLLEEEGFGAAVRQFDMGSPKSSNSTNSTTYPSWGPRTVQERHQQWLQDRENSGQKEDLELFRTVFASLRKTVATHFENCGSRVLAVTDVTQGQRAGIFLRKWRSSGGVPILIYHGTRAGNIASIVDRGLIVPGKGGVRIVNGNVYGDGIYSALSPSVSINYSDDRRCMFACVGLVGGNTGTRGAGDYRIFSDAKCILPLWVIHFAARGGRKGKHQEPIEEASERLGTDWSLAQLAAHLRGAPTSFPKAKPLQSQAPGNAPVVTKKIQEAAYGGKVRLVGDEGHDLPCYVPREIQYKGVTKKMLKKAPRYLKDFYNEGFLKGKTSS